ncbi:DUF5134 domain-containing protein [Streptomyces physcomitrii]|uniref:DUF5134 domain-containing protein n=1 Tax=Streptomyces physcomitrii TaxID=2724184 RepID=A0ABX1H447_9ACTN|nr:DUF5134 domain-containing protein [Streptomyces physcomitrii]NKI42034.1 DUF5134 domain-containing protein [Streptomyces physcomitrii]
MHGPASAAWLLVAVCLAAGAYCLLRMRSGVAAQRRAAGAEAVMGAGMAAMAVPASVLSPGRGAWSCAALVFAVLALRHAWSARRERHHLHHLVGSGAMAYMAVAMAARPPGAHAAHTAAGLPYLTGALLLYFTGYVLWSGARLLPAAAAVPVPGTAAWGDRPELAQVCRLSMGLGMLAMLLAM